MEIKVYADWMDLKGPLLMGMLTVIHVRGREVFSFAYDSEWLKNPQAQILDPDLQLFSGPQYLAPEKKNFGIFLDSSPDRWGQVLMKRREAIIARMENRKEKTLFQEDYLLGVFDGQRMGALRFKLDAEGPFLNDNALLAAPPWTSLRELEQASLALERETLGDAESLKWINMLMAPGASLGGARPKAGVKDESGDIWIAKFPSAGDRFDIGAWEMLANSIAEKAGLHVAAGQLKKFAGKHHTFLSKRFDRRAASQRIHFASAMTLLGHSDGVTGVSYLDIAEFIIKNGANTSEDLEELWRRIVFNISIKNTDDHLRNHGFILNANGWRLSPAYDMNPNYSGAGLTLNISETDNSLNFDLALSVAKYFRISKAKSLAIVEKVKQSVRGWRSLAKRLSIPTSEQQLMARAFDLVHTSE